MDNTLKVRRAERDITQLDLAEKVGVSDSHISLIERGKVDPTPELAEKIAKALRSDVGIVFPELAEQQAEAR